MVSACIAVAAGVRADSWQTDVPSLMREVCAPIQHSGEKQSEPHASAVHTESYPRRSASCASSTKLGVGSACQ